MDDERRNPIDFGSRGQRSRSTLPPCEGMPRFALSSLFLNSYSAETEVQTYLCMFKISSSPLPVICVVMSPAPPTCGSTGDRARPPRTTTAPSWTDLVLAYVSSDYILSITWNSVWTKYLGKTIGSKERESIYAVQEYTVGSVGCFKDLRCFSDILAISRLRSRW